MDSNNLIPFSVSPLAKISNFAVGAALPIPTLPVLFCMVNFSLPPLLVPSYILKLALLYEPTNHLPVPPLDNLSPKYPAAVAESASK